MRWRPAHAGGIALALVAVAVATPLLLGGDASSALGPRGVVERDVSSFDALGHPSRFAFARPVTAGLDPERDALVVVEPTTGYSSREVGELAAFLDAGGRVLVASSAGAGADLLDRLGAGVTTGRARVYTPAFEDAPARIVALTTGELPGLPAEVVLSRPTIVEGGTPVLVAPELAWEDANENGRPDLDERLDRGFVLAARTRVGEGVLVVVGDPDAVDADRLPVTARALIDFAGDDGERTLVFDEAHRAFSDPFGANALLAGRAGALLSTGILMMAAVVGALAVLGPRLARDARRRRHRLVGAGADDRLLGVAMKELEES